LSSPLRIGTRGSALALAQARGVLEDLRRLHAGLDAELVPIKTSGDRQAGPLTALGGKGLFTAELEDALRAGRIDLAVHSLKDLPVALPEGLALGAVPERASPFDVLVHRRGWSLRLLPPGTRLGTGSPRRALCLKVSSPHLEFVALRGNVDTRLRKMDAGEVDGLVLAHAGLIRLGRADRVTEPIPLLSLLPAPGQGCLGIEVRAGDGRVRDLLAPLHHPPSALEAGVERALLEDLGGGCRMALGTLARAEGERVRLTAMLASADGRRLFRAEGEGEAGGARALARSVADALRAQGAPVG